MGKYILINEHNYFSVPLEDQKLLLSSFPDFFQVNE